jgi:hypothetical protein
MVGQQVTGFEVFLIEKGFRAMRGQHPMDLERGVPVGVTVTDEDSRLW